MARSFTTSDSGITSSPATTSTANVTIASWFLVPTGSSITGYIVFFSNGTTGGYGLAVSNNGNGLFCGIANGRSAFGDIAYTRDVWHHGLLTIDTLGNSQAEIVYLDGVATSAAGNPGFNAVNVGTTVGGNNYAGRIADSAIWSIKLTQAEITALAKGARPRDIRPQNLVFWAPLDGIASPEPDLSGNKLNITMTGSALAFGPPLMPFTPRWPQFPIQAIPAQVFILMPQIVT